MFTGGTSYSNQPPDRPTHNDWRSIYCLAVCLSVPGTGTPARFYISAYDACISVYDACVSDYDNFITIQITLLFLLPTFVFLLPTFGFSMYPYRTVDNTVP